jgi:hypothetical protein
VNPVIGWTLFIVLMIGLVGIVNTLSPDTMSVEEQMRFSYEEPADPPRPKAMGPCIACLEDRIADLERKSMADD